MIARDDQLTLAAAANRAPSVHNIQPARFRFDEAGVTVLEDRARRIPIGDPEGKDNWKSLGAAFEGMAIALSARGLGLAPSQLVGGAEADLRTIARASISSEAPPDPFVAEAETRATWRGMFARPTSADAAAFERLRSRCADVMIVEKAEAVAALAKFYDEVSLLTLRDEAYRAELLSWMRLSRSDPNYARDGLNAEHMALRGFEAAGAGLVLKPKIFPTLDKLGLAGPLIAEGGKVRSAAGVVLFHRPVDEHEFDTGRRFYRVWLEIEREGLCLCPMSVLADSPSAAAKLMTEYGIGADRKLVNVFRVGRRPANATHTPRARLPAAALLV